MLNITRSPITLISILSCLIMFFSDQALAQGPKLTGKHIKTTCPPCQDIVDDINAVIDDLANVSQALDDIAKSISVDEQFIQKDKERIASIESMPPSPKKAQELATANKVLHNDQQDLKNHEKVQHDLNDKYYSLLGEKYLYLDELDDCEYYECGRGAFQYWFYRSNNSPYYLYQQLLYQMMQIQIGLMVGNMPGVRTTHFNVLDEDFYGSNTENSADIGLQAKFIFGPSNKVKPTVTLNALHRFNASNTIFNDRLSSFSDMNSWVTLNTSWIARALVGIESPTFYNKFTAGISAGVAVFDQSLKSKINGTELSKSTTSVGPSIAANLSYRACQNCLLGHPLSISAQVISDQFPSVSAQQNFTKVTVNQRWQFSENLIFSVDFDRSH